MKCSCYRYMPSSTHLFFELIRYPRGCEGVKDHKTGPNLKKHSALQPFEVHVGSRNQEWALKIPFGFGTIIAFAILTITTPTTTAIMTRVINADDQAIFLSILLFAWALDNQSLAHMVLDSAAHSLNLFQKSASLAPTPLLSGLGLFLDL